MKSVIDKLKSQLKTKRTQAKNADVFDKVNLRCRELGLCVPTDEQMKGQGCQYRGGYPGGYTPA